MLKRQWLPIGEQRKLKPLGWAICVVHWAHIIIFNFLCNYFPPQNLQLLSVAQRTPMISLDACLLLPPDALPSSKSYLPLSPFSESASTLGSSPIPALIFPPWITKAKVCSIFCGVRVQKGLSHFPFYWATYTCRARDSLPIHLGLLWQNQIQSLPPKVPLTWHLTIG